MPGKIDASKIVAEKPRDFGDFSASGQKKIHDYALAVRQGTINLNDVPESYRGAVYQRVIGLGADNAAEAIGKVGLNTALAMTDPVGYAAGYAAQKGLAYANDRASGRNEYDASGILGYTPIRGTEYAAEHPVSSALTDIAAGVVGGGVVRNAGTVAMSAEQAAQNAAAVSGMEREVLSYPSVGSKQAFGTVFKSGTKGSGKTGTVRSAGRGSSGYAPNVSAKGVYSNASSGSPSVINWYTPSAELPVSPVPFNGPGVPPILWNGPAEPQTVLVEDEKPVMVQQPVLSVPGKSRTPQEVYNSIRGNTFAYGGPEGENDPDFVGPPTPLSVTIANHTRDTYDEQAKKYDDRYPNIAYYLRQSGNLRGQRLGANEAMYLRYAPEDIVRLQGTKSHNVPVTRAVLDSAAVNGAKAGVSPYVALGIPAQETNFGYYPTAAWDAEDLREWQNMTRDGYAVEKGGVSPIEMLNNAAYAVEPYGSALSYVVKKAGAGYPIDDATYGLDPEATAEQLAKVEELLAKDRAYTDKRASKFSSPESVFRNAYELYKTGKYNPGDPRYNEMVEAAGADVFLSPQVQTWWNESGRKYYEKYAPGLLKNFSDGGGIHIAPSKKGTFTAAAKKHGKSVQAFASQVLANPGRYSAAMRKKANFARNATKWHEDGGLIDRLKSVYGDNPDDIMAAILRAKNVKK